MSENVNTRLVIDPVTRTITPKYRNQKAVYVAKGDHNSVLICFEMPRYVDGYDMSAEENAIQIHYANMDGKDERKVSKGFSDAINITAEENEVTNEAVVSFCWLVPKTATRYAGVVSIGITFERYDNVDGKAQEVYSWSTAPYGKTIVWDSLDNSAEVVEREYNYLVDTCNAIVASEMKNKISEAEQIIDKKISNAKNEIDKAIDQKITDANRVIDSKINELFEGKITSTSAIIDYERGTLNASGIKQANTTFIRSSEYLPKECTFMINQAEYVVVLYLYQNDTFIKRIKLMDPTIPACVVPDNYYLSPEYDYKFIAKYNDNRVLTDEDISALMSDIYLFKQSQTFVTKTNTLTGLDTANSWWCNPRIEYNELRDNLYVTGIDREGLAKINIFNLRNGITKTVRLSHLNKDDHNTPTLLIQDDKPPVVAYTGHAQFNYVNVRVGKKPYDVEGLETANTIQVSFANEDNKKCTYSSLISFARDSKLVLITRLGGDLYMSVSQNWGQTWGTPKLFVTGLYYATFKSDGGNWLHYIFATHPTEHGNTNIRYLKFDVRNGDYYNASDELLGNIFNENFSGISINDVGTSVLATSEYNVRVLDVHKHGSVLCCEIDRTNPQNGGMYFVLGKDGNAWTRTDICQSGVPVGYYQSAYVGGACFDSKSNAGLGIYVCREENGIWYTEHRIYNYNYGEVTYIVDNLIEKSTYKMGRPSVAFRNSGKAFTYLKYYQYATDVYSDYYADQICIRADK